MKTKFAAAFFVAGTLMLPFAGYSADGDKDRSSPKDFVKDSVITAKIKADLAAEKMSSLVKISVDTDAKGAVVLSGTAPSQAAVDKAVAIARGVKGVTSVKYDITVTDK